MHYSRYSVLVALPFVVLLACSGGDDPPPPPPAESHPDDALGQFGASPNTPEFEAAPAALPVEALLEPPVAPTLPASVTLTNLPPIGMQGTSEHLGSPGSCEAWSYGYGLGSYTAARLPDGSDQWDPSDTTYQVSSAWLYRWAHVQEMKSCPTGSLTVPYLSRLVSVGAPSMAQVPYMADCTYLESIDVNQIWPAEDLFQLGSFAIMNLSHAPADLAEQTECFRQFLNAGNALAFTGLVLQDYATAPVMTEGVIYETTTVAGSGHGQLVIGYDDTVGTAAQPGAFLVQNSFGTDWPPAASGSTAPPGMAWWSYATFFSTQAHAAVAYPVDPATPSGTVLTGSSGAPAASVVRAWQWSPDGSTDTTLALWHAFAALVELATLCLTEPAPGTHSVTATYDEALRTGYTYIRRSDSNAFLAGDWTLELTGELVDGTAITYTGTISVGTPLPNTPPAAALTDTTAVTGPTGAAATIGP